MNYYLKASIFHLDGVENMEQVIRLREEESFS